MAKKQTPMTMLTCKDSPELLVTYPRVEFRGGYAETDEETAQIILDELGDLYGIVRTPVIPAEEAPVEEAPAEVPAEG